MVIPGLHLTLGIFLKLFKVFDQACRRLDFRIGHKGIEDENLEEVMNKVFFTEDKIFNYQDSLAACTEIFFHQLSQLDDENETERTQLQEKYMDHKNKVEEQIKKLVSEQLLL